MIVDWIFYIANLHLCKISSGLVSAPGVIVTSMLILIRIRRVARLASAKVIAILTRTVVSVVNVGSAVVMRLVLCNAAMELLKTVGIIVIN